MNQLLSNPVSYPSENILIASETQLGYFLNAPQTEKEVNLSFTVEKNASLVLTFVDLSPSSLTVHLTADLKEGASAEVSVCSLASLKEEKIYRVDINHLEGKTYSRTIMAGINAGEGILKFLGNSYIKNGAHQSDTRQEGKITNLSPNAKSEVSPALLIKENDVKASHGAALGSYNPEELFYLMSRGLTLDESKRLITFGYLLPIIEKLGDGKILEEAKATLGGLRS
jgi:Fe-S cluster assembly protein SufD